MMTIGQIKSDIEDRSDGPLTAFVLMSRTMSLVSDGSASADEAANALYEVLEERGMLVEGNVEVPGT